MKNKGIEFGITQEHLYLIDEVRATLNLIAVMGMDGTNERITHLSKTDLITVLESITSRLQKIQTEAVTL